MPRIDLDAWKAAVEAEEAPDDVLLYKGFVANEIKVLEAERAIRFVISTADVDRDRDTIAVDGWELADYRRNPVILFGHSYREPPVARALEVSVEGGKLKSLAQFADASVYPFADTIYRMLKAGYLNATSVGFRPIEWVYNEERRGIDFKKQTLLEFSVVPVPSNSHCLVEMRDAGMITDDDAKLYLGWAEQILDEWHGEKGLWLPKSKIEEAFIALRSKTVVDMGKDGKEEDPEDKIICPHGDYEKQCPECQKKWGRDRNKEIQEDENNDLDTGIVTRPLENMHAGRVRNPADFQAESFRTIERRANNKPIQMIVGRLKGEDTMTLQAFQYNKRHWDVSSARQHCKDHGGMLFEPAKTAGVDCDHSLDDERCQCCEGCAEAPEAREQTQALQTITHEGEIVSDDELNDWLARELETYNYHPDPDPLAAVTPDMIGQVLLDMIRGSVDDALKRQITAITGRLVD